MPSDSTDIRILKPSDRDGDGIDAGGGGEGTVDPSPSKGTGAMQQRGCIQAVVKHARACRETGCFSRPAEQDGPRTRRRRLRAKIHVRSCHQDLLPKIVNFAQ